MSLDSLHNLLYIYVASPVAVPISGHGASKGFVMSGKRKPNEPSTRKKLGVDRMEAFDNDLKKFLNPGQCCYVQMLVDRLEDFGREDLTTDLRIEKIEGKIWELKAKNNVLGKINVRVFFAFLPKHGGIVALAAFKKETEGATRPHWKIKILNRLAQYMRSIKDSS